MKFEIPQLGTHESFNLVFVNVNVNVNVVVSRAQAKASMPASYIQKSSQVKSMMLTDAGSHEPLCPYHSYNTTITFQ